MVQNRSFFIGKTLYIIVILASMPGIYSFEKYFEKLTVLTKATYEQTVHWEHAAVIRSLRQGLELLHIPFNYNPSLLADVGDSVLVVSGDEALSQALELKRQKRIKKLFVGPNFYPHKVNFPEVDLYFVPSAWVMQQVKEDCPNIFPRTRVWFAGVDIDSWKTRHDRITESKNVLVYWKTEPLDFCLSVEELLRRYGWSPIRLQYGSYNVEQYKSILNDCQFAVFISVSESQGLALAECWSMDVPTLPWNPQRALIVGQMRNYVSACPYLTSETGVSWQTLDELETIMRSLDTNIGGCEPRGWVAQHMTDEISVQELVKIIHETCREE